MFCECGCGGVTRLARQTDTKRGTVRGQHQRFIMGHSGAMNKHRPPGTYVSVMRGDNAEWEHRVIAEKALGRPLPAKSEIHHVDGDGRNNSPGNLVICEDKAYHWLLHRRSRVRAAGGNPNTDVWCSSCQAPRPMELFTVRLSGRGAGRFVSSCRNCAREQYREQHRRGKVA